MTRDIALLELLKQKRYVRREHIFSLLPEFPSISVLNRRLKVLFEKHFIDRYFPQMPQGKGTSQQYVCLDRAGAVYLDLDKFSKPIRYTPDGQRYLPSDWRHHTKILDTECYLRDNYNVIFIEQEKARKYDLTKKVIPDLFAFLKQGNQGQVLFIEVDMGTEDMNAIKAKFQRYREYYWSHKWASEKWARKFVEPAFPCLIFSTVDRPQRVKAIQSYLKDIGFLTYVVPHDEAPKVIDTVMSYNA